MSKIDAAVGAVLREKRKAAGLTLAEVGRKARPQVDPALLSRIERGRATTTLEKYAALAKVLGLTLAELLDAALPRRA